MCGGDEAIDRAPVAGGKLLGEGVADQRDRLLQSEQAAIALRLQPGAKVPEVETGIGFALLQLLKDQGRRAIFECRLALEIDALAHRGRLDDQPALVERAAGHREHLALEVTELPQR